MSEIKKILNGLVGRERWTGTVNWVGVGSIPGGRTFFGEKIFFYKFFFFQKNIFPGVFKWFRLHKKVSLTTLGPSGMPGEAPHSPSQAPHGLQNCQNGQNRHKWPKIAQNHPKMTFFWLSKCLYSKWPQFCPDFELVAHFWKKNAKMWWWQHGRLLLPWSSGEFRH